MLSVFIKSSFRFFQIYNFSYVFYYEIACFYALLCSQPKSTPRSFEFFDQSILTKSKSAILTLFANNTVTLNFLIKKNKIFNFKSLIRIFILIDMNFKTYRTFDLKRSIFAIRSWSTGIQSVRFTTTDSSFRKTIVTNKIRHT